MIFYTRRDFLRTGLLGGALTATIPSFLLGSMNTLHAAADGALTQTPTGKDASILVILQLAGGNDGLNTIIPIGNDDYDKARPRLAVKKNQIIPLDNGLGMHAQMEALRPIYEAGKMAVIQGIGYPNPNRSHFRSMEIWHTASDSEEVLRRGWLGRFFDAQCKGCDASIAISLGKQFPQAFTAKLPKGVALAKPQQYRATPSMMMAMDAMMEDSGEAPEDEALSSEDPEAYSGSSIEHLSAPPKLAEGQSPLDYLERTELDARSSSEQIRSILKSQKGKPSAKYPGSRLAQDLQNVSHLIAGGMPTRIYYVSMGGFDTHTGQSGSHPRLLKEFSEATAAFLKDLRQQGNLDRTTLMVFSEFGRRVKENASGGTDHGAGAPALLFGGSVKPGIHGETPSLAPDDLDRGDVKYHTDFRRLYATVLEKALKVSSKDALRGKFSPLDVIS